MIRARLAARAPFLALVGLALVLLAGCSSGDDGEEQGVVTLAPPTTTASGSADVQTLDFQDAVLEVTACLREAGFDVPDPVFDATGVPSFPGAEDLGIDTTSEEFLAAFEDCSAPLSEAVPNIVDNLDPQLAADIRDALGEYAACMRENGVEDFPDPRPSGAFFDIAALAATQADGDFETANQRCQAEIQFPGIGGE